jgi:hypothetical protein
MLVAGSGSSFTGAASWDVGGKAALRYKAMENPFLRTRVGALQFHG